MLMTPSIITAFLSDLLLNTSLPSIHSTTIVLNYTMQCLASQAVKVHGLWCDTCAPWTKDVTGQPRQSFFPAPSGELKVTSTRKLRLGPSQRKSTNIPL